MPVDALNALREETEQSVADLRRCMEILHEDSKSTTRLVVETLGATIDGITVELGPRVDGHERRLVSVELRVTALERKRQ